MRGLIFGRNDTPILVKSLAIPIIEVEVVSIGMNENSLCAGHRIDIATFTANRIRPSGYKTSRSRRAIDLRRSSAN